MFTYHSTTTIIIVSDVRVSRVYIPSLHNGTYIRPIQYIYVFISTAGAWGRTIVVPIRRKGYFFPVVVVAGPRGSRGMPKKGYRFSAWPDLKWGKQEYILYYIPERKTI